MMARSSSVAALALLFLQAAQVHANLNQLAKAAGKLYFGSATDNSELSDSAYTAILYVVHPNSLRRCYKARTAADLCYCVWEWTGRM